MFNQEQYAAKAVAANATQVLADQLHVCGFLCTTAGTLRIGAGADGLGTAIVDTLTIIAGGFYPMPFTVTGVSALVLAGGAVGTLFAGV